MCSCVRNVQICEVINMNSKPQAEITIYWVYDNNKIIGAYVYSLIETGNLCYCDIKEVRSVE